MKKIVSAAAIAAMVAGVASADVTFAANARVYTDAYTYTSTTKNKKDAADAAGSNEPKGTTTFFKDAKHADDVTLNAKGENAGAKIVFSVDAGTAGNTANVTATTYQLWMNFGSLRLDAGKFDQRPVNLASYDGNWNNNYGSPNKPGFYSDVTGGNFGKDNGNLVLKGDRKNANVMMASYSFKSAFDLPLNVRAAAFLTGSTSTTVDANDKDSHLVFVPWGIQADYTIGSAKIAFTSIVQNITATKATATTEYYRERTWTNALIGTFSPIENTTMLLGYTAGNQFYTGDVDNVSDLNKMAHAFDFRVENKSIDNLGLYLDANLTILSMSKVEKDAPGDDEAKAKAGNFKKLGYWVTFGGQYKLSDAVTVGLQTKIANKNVKDVVTNKDGKDEFCATKNMTINVRPAVDITASKNCVFSAGVDIGLSKPYSSQVEGTTDEASNLTTTVSIPVMMRIKL